MKHPNQSIQTVLRSINIGGKEYDEFLKTARRNLYTYFHKNKLPSLFVETIDSCKFIDFNAPRDRRILNRESPSFKVKILYDKIPKEVADVLPKNKSISDIKTKIVHEGLISPFIDRLLDVIDRRDPEYLKESIPSKEEQQEFIDILTALFVINTENIQDRPIFIRPFI